MRREYVSPSMDIIKVYMKHIVAASQDVQVRNDLSETEQADLNGSLRVKNNAWDSAW